MHVVAANLGLGGLTTALGVNLSTLLFNISAFLVFAWLLGKFVFPALTRAIDLRRDGMLATDRLKQQAESALATTEATAAQLLDQARLDASDVLARAQTEATTIAQAARAKAETQSQRLVDEAHKQLAGDMDRARQQLKAELAKLVAAETQALLGSELSSSLDTKLIARQLKGHQS